MDETGVGKNNNMIREAKSSEHMVLTKISFDSKAYWHYPDEYYKIWENELTISSEYILENNVYIYEQNGCVVGYCSIVEVENDFIVSDIKIEAGTWLEHMFVLQEFIGRGIGKKLFFHCVEKLKYQNIKQLKIFADPNSRAFYEKMGCCFVRDCPSTIIGRTIPYLEYELKGTLENS